MAILSSAKRILPHATLSVLLSALMSLGLGYRNLWVDELETAERAKSILVSGIPQTIDENGKVSVNAAGREIEETHTHRYTPWAQYYVGALGLWVGTQMGLSQDASLRLPFAVAHGATSGILSYALVRYMNAPLAIALATGAALGIQTNRIVHNRTSRYHSILDLLTALGILALGGLVRNKKWAPLLLGVSLALFFQTHTLGGSLLVAVFFVLTAIVLYEKRTDTSNTDIFVCATTIMIPVLLSLFFLLTLTRPWLQGHWGQFTPHFPRSFFNLPTISYSFLFAGAWSFYLYRTKNKKRALIPFAIIATSILVISFLDLHPFSQKRYYFSVALIALFWGLFIKPDLFSDQARIRFYKSLMITILAAEILLGRLTRHDAYFPFQGLRIIADDFKKQSQGVKQPLHLAVDFIKQHSQPSDAVLTDYVPQFVNWYLPEHPIALMPDLKAKTELNKNNPIWNMPQQFPIWHLWYSKWGTGNWICLNDCDFKATDLDLKNRTYILTSKSLKRSEKMCVQSTWMTDHWNNAPFAMLSNDSFTPQGFEFGPLILGRLCP